MNVATNQQNPIRQALNTATREQLENLILNIHDILYLEIERNEFKANPDKELDAESIDLIIEAFVNHGFAPDEEYIEVGGAG